MAAKSAVSRMALLKQLKNLSLLHFRFTRGTAKLAGARDRGAAAAPTHAALVQLPLLVCPLGAVAEAGRAAARQTLAACQLLKSFHIAVRRLSRFLCLLACLLACAPRSSCNYSPVLV